jgi:hypothetical protein
MDHKHYIYDIAEDNILRDLQSPDLEPRMFASIEEVNYLKEEIHKKNNEIELLRKKIDEHEDLIFLMKVRAVQCLSVFNKFKDQHMYRESKTVLKLDDLLKVVNKVLPEHMRPMDRIELLNTTRQLAETQNLEITWRKSNSEYVCDGWVIRKLANVKNVSLIQATQQNAPRLVSLQQPSVNIGSSSPMIPRSPANSSMSPPPVTVNRHI